MAPLIWKRRQIPKSALLKVSLYLSSLSSALWLLPSIFALVMAAFGPPNGLGFLLYGPVALGLLVVAAVPPIFASERVCAAEVSGELGRAHVFALAPLLMNFAITMLLFFALG